MHHAIVPVLKGWNDGEFYEYFCKNKKCDNYEDGFFVNDTGELVHFN